MSGAHSARMRQRHAINNGARVVLYMNSHIEQPHVQPCVANKPHLKGSLHVCKAGSARLTAMSNLPVTARTNTISTISSHRR